MPSRSIDEIQEDHGLLAGIGGGNLRIRFYRTRVGETVTVSPRDRNAFLQRLFERAPWLLHRAPSALAAER